MNRTALNNRGRSLLLAQTHTLNAFRRIVNCTLLLTVMGLASVTNAALVSVDFVYGAGTNLSQLRVDASATYDSTTGTACTPFTGWLCYTPITLDLLYSTDGTAVGQLFSGGYTYLADSRFFLVLAGPQTLHGLFTTTSVEWQGAPVTNVPNTWYLDWPASNWSTQFRMTWKSPNLVVYTGGLVSKGVPTAVIPVPAAVWLFGSGMIGLIGAGKARKSA